MDFLSEGQITGLIFFAAGIFILNWCGKMERREYKAMRDDPKAKWQMIDKEETSVAQAKRRSARGFIMTLVGVGCALYGAVIFFMNI